MIISINFSYNIFCHASPAKVFLIGFRASFFTSIQEAINCANPGDAIYVSEGVYFEHIVVNKSVSIFGSDPSKVIIDGGGEGVIVEVTASGFVMSGFTIKNGLSGLRVVNCRYVNFSFNTVEDVVHGVYFLNAEFNVVFKNNFTRNSMSIVLQNSNSNIISENNFYHNNGQSVSLYNSSYNVIFNNKITRNPAFAIYLEKSFNNTLTMNDVSYVCQGITLHFSHNNSISKNIIKNTGPNAITVELSNDNRLYENFLVESEIAFQLLNSNFNLIWKNNITRSKLGIWISRSSGNILRDNCISENRPFGNFGVYGERLEDFLNYVDVTNRVDEAPIYYLLNQHGIVLSEKVGYIALVNSSDVVVENITLMGNYQGLALAYSTNITLNDLKIENNFQGVYLSHSNFNFVTGCSFNGNVYNFYFQNSNSNLIFANNFYGGKILYSSISSNYWDGGYPCGGNYWSEFKLPDNFMGPYQNITGPDGISDVPVYLYGENVDKYPLAAPIKIFGTEFSKNYFFSFVSNSSILNFQFNPFAEPSILFTAAGPLGTIGFCRVAIPKKLLWVEDVGWKVLLGNNSITFTRIGAEDYVYFYFTYVHSDTIKICGTNAIPEYAGLSLWFVLTILASITFLMKKLIS
jgi:parallel beta-helix repeat protein